MPLYPALAFDLASRTAATSGPGQLWNSSDSGHAWSLNGAVDDGTFYSIGGSTNELYAFSKAGSGSRALLWGVPGTQQQEILVRFKVNTINQPTDFGPMMWADNSSGTLIYSYIKMDAGMATVSTVGKPNATTASFTFAADTWYWCRSQMTKGTWKVRVWADGVAEPGTWLINQFWVTTPVVIPPVQVGWVANSTATSYLATVGSYYYYDMLTAAPSVMPVNYNFSVDRGAGMGASTDKKTFWCGAWGDDPGDFARTRQGTSSVANGYASFNLDGVSGSGYTGSLAAKDSDVLIKVRAAGSGARFRLFLRHQPTADTGYNLRMQTGSTTVQLSSWNAGAETSLGTQTLAVAPAANEWWWMRIRAVGSTITGRVWKDGTAEPGTWGITATNATYTTGCARLQMTSLATIYDLGFFSFTEVSNTNQLTPGIISTPTLTSVSAQIAASYTNDANNNSTATIQYKMWSDETWTTVANTVNRTSKVFTSSLITALAPNTLYNVMVTYADAEGVLGQAVVTSSFTTPNDAAQLNYDAVVTNLTDSGATVTLKYDGDINNNATAQIQWKTLAGAFNAGVGMTRDTTARTFSYTITGLTADTTYIYQITVTDTNTVLGTRTNPYQDSFRTVGVAVALVTPNAIGVSVTPTTAAISVNYLYDSNSNSTLSVQYKEARSLYWTTITQSRITAVRGSKQFKVNLDSLTPNTTYQVFVVISDPDGVVVGTLDNQTATFTTTGFTSEPGRRLKQYLYKVYAQAGDYLGTWNDAPEPSFDYDENGGVTDMLLTLNRPLSSFNVDDTIALMNRVDVWAVDGQSDGMGPNTIFDKDGDKGSWTFSAGNGAWSTGTNAAGNGPAGGPASLRTSTGSSDVPILSENIAVLPSTPYVLKMLATSSARGTSGANGKLYVQIQAYNASNTLIDVSPDRAETIGTAWQTLRMDYTTPAGTSYVKVIVNSEGVGVQAFCNVWLLPKQFLIYRGNIENYEYTVSAEGEHVELTIIGFTSQLTDDYIEFLQYVTTGQQPSKDTVAGRVRRNPTDPSQMMKDIIDEAKSNNPNFLIWYDATSIKMTGSIVQYTFRETTIINCLDKVRVLAPPGWHYFVEPSGRLNFRGPEHTQTHRLRLGIDVLNFKASKGCKNIKNFIHVKGRQDENKSEPDGFGNIDYFAADPASIAQFGRRVLYVRDSAVKDNDTAKIVGDGTLEETTQLTQASTCVVPDEKQVRFMTSSDLRPALQGYNIERFQPGDYVTVIDVRSNTAVTYWDHFRWDIGWWDAPQETNLPKQLPIKTIHYRGHEVELELSERQPSARGNYAKMRRYLQLLELNTNSY